MTTPRPVSPAAAAAVSRLLRGAGLLRAIEHSKGIEYQGYWAEPHGDHVVVDYTPGFDVVPEHAVDVARPGLERCKAVLVKAGYNVTETTNDHYVYGGNPPMTMPVLEVRKPEWTRRDGDA